MMRGIANADIGNGGQIKESRPAQHEETVIED